MGEIVSHIGIIFLVFFLPHLELHIHKVIRAIRIKLIDLNNVERETPLPGPLD